VDQRQEISLKLPHINYWRGSRNCSWSIWKTHQHHQVHSKRL